MNCMKCGREIGEDAVFCEDCLLEMEKYPIKPGTVVQLPRRTEAAGAKKAHSRRRANLSPEEQVKLLRKRLRQLSIGLIAALVVIAALSIFTISRLLDSQKFLPGQNYSAINHTEPMDTE